jgi:hypothetical protein
MRFSDWAGNLKVKLEKGTSVLTISYTDTDRSMVLPVIDRISKTYQVYSGRDRRRNIAKGVTYLRQNIDSLAPKAEASMQRAQAYALSNGLGLTDGMPAAAAEATGGGSVEASRQQAQARVLLLEQQLAQASLLSSRPTTSSTINIRPQRLALATCAAACATTTISCATFNASASA